MLCKLCHLRRIIAIFLEFRSQVYVCIFGGRRACMYLFLFHSIYATSFLSIVIVWSNSGTLAETILFSFSFQV